MILYEKGTTNFSKNGLGYLNNIINANVTEKLNGEYSLVFEYPINETLSNELIEERIVKCKVADGTEQCFIIKNIVKTYQKMTITCVHLFYLLLTNLAEDIYPQELTPKPFLDWILTRANYQLPFTTTSDVAITKSARYVRKNLVEVIMGNIDNSMTNLFGIEIKRNNWNIGLNARLGEDKGEKLIYGKNITGINLTIDTNDMYTRIMPIGFDGLLLPEKYIDADNINDYPYPKIGIFEFSDIRYDPNDPSAYQTLQDAYQALRDAVNELYANDINKPQVNMKINWLELSQTEEYKQYLSLERVTLGDTIHVEIFGLDYTTRVIKTVYNPLNNRIEEFEIGTFQPSYATQMNKYEIDLKQMPESILAEAQENATNLITNAMGGYVYKTNSELYIMDNQDPAQALKVWRWNINGLAYSSTGINGTYALAMTMDGSIVADMITTGTLNANVISGATVLSVLAGSQINLTSGNITINSTNFSVDSGGNMTCSNATITGGEVSLIDNGATETVSKIKVKSFNDVFTSELFSQGLIIKSTLNNDVTSIQANNWKIENQTSKTEIANGIVEMQDTDFSTNLRKPDNNDGTVFNTNYGNQTAIKMSNLAGYGKLQVNGEYIANDNNGNEKFNVNGSTGNMQLAGQIIMGNSYSNVDADDFVNPGIYYLQTGCLNVPTNWFYMISIRAAFSNSSDMIQFGFDSSCNLYIRFRNNATWGNWVRK